MKHLNLFEQFEDPYGEENNNDLPIEDLEDDTKYRSLEELIGELEEKKFLDENDLSGVELDTIEYNLLDVVYRGVNLSDNCNIFQLRDFIIKGDFGDEYGQGYYIELIGKITE
jgi:hypothetical protein